MEPPLWQENYHRELARKQERRRQRAAEEQAQKQRLQALAPLPQRTVPHPWEDLASLLSRTARKMGYERPEWILHPQDVPYRINPATIAFLSRSQDYLFLGRHLLLEQEQLYRLTLHRFAPRFTQQSPAFSFTSVERPPAIAQPGLSYDVSRRFFLTGRQTRVCPHCLEEEEGYDRLYWRCTLVLFCPRHQLFLLPQCPDCHAPIPALRPSSTQCPVCKRGEYRRAILPVLPEDHWLQLGHATLLGQLGIDGMEAEGQAMTTRHTRLAHLLPWEYFQVLGQCFTFRELLSLTGQEEEADHFFLRVLPLEHIITRLSTSLHQAPFTPIGALSHQRLATALPGVSSRSAAVAARRLSLWTQ